MIDANTNRRAVYAIDPGTEKSAFVLFDGTQILDHGILPNGEMLAALEHSRPPPPLVDPFSRLAVEMVASYGMPVGKELFDTCVWIGRFIQVWGLRHLDCDGSPAVDRVYRKDVKLHLCHTLRAGDPHVRQALIDRFGPGRAAAIGHKSSPGPLHGIKSHEWAALAVAVTWWDTMRC